jgi:3-phenylpropionate/trans-cinnamate dioxygenase ferredoxin subunit
MPETDREPGFRLEGYATENPTCDPQTPLEQAFRVLDEARPPKARSRGRLVVGAASEIAPGERRIVDDAETGLSIGVFNVGGRFFAVKNVCPHLGAPLCRGSIHATHRPGQVHEYREDFSGRILRCPWHGWEFDVVTGKALYDAKSRVATYACEVDESGDVVVLV